MKAECLQTAGSVWYRGYLHYLLRSLGRFKGIVLHGDDAMILAQAVAGGLHRLPMVAVCGPGQAAVAARVEEFGVEVERAAGDVGGGLDGGVTGVVAAIVTDVAQARARHDGFHFLPAAEESAVAVGLATLGLELAEQLPADVARVVVTSDAFAAPVRAGFDAAGRSCEVVVAASGSFSPESPEWKRWKDAVGIGLRILVDDVGLAALWQERASRAPTCVIL